MIGQIRTKITRNRIRELKRQARRAAAEMTVRTANEAAKIARKLVPVDTGALRSTIALLQDVRNGSATLVAGDDNVLYAAAVEYGVPSRNQPAQPFMRPAIEQVRKSARRRTQNIRVYR